MRIQLWPILACATMVLACGAAGSQIADHGSVSGTVVYRGCTGTAPTNPTACDAPKSGVTLTFKARASQRTYDVTTQDRGRYAVDLPEGDYSVAIHVKTPIIDGPETVSVTRGANVVANFVVAAPYQ